MDAKEREEVDEQLSGWILSFLDRQLKKGFTVRQVSRALQWAHESFAVEHMYDGWGDREAPEEPEAPETEEPQESAQEEGQGDETCEVVDLAESVEETAEDVVITREAPEPEPVPEVRGVSECGVVERFPMGDPLDPSPPAPTKPPKLPKHRHKWDEDGDRIDPDPPRPKGDPDKGFCAKCGKKMTVENSSSARYTVFVLWKCKCGFQHLEKRHRPAGREGV